ncbi:hypothetical protein GBA52_017635 [Prunus armeniaca]|nr:hypothetical protein GBA52_017634 [Prunus armeniaca]KAH0975736.1 hypothetical protein GBA52_017635 [Prunus armeniaca]
MTHVPQLYIVRYKRNVTEEGDKPKENPKSIWDAVQDQELDPASQLVAKYNGSNEIPELVASFSPFFLLLPHIMKWISQIIKYGDSRDLPHYRTRTPHLVPEDSESI